MDNPKEAISGKLDDLSTKVHSDTIYYGVKPFAKASKEKEVTDKDRMMWAALTGLSSAAATTAITQTVGKYLPTKLKVLYPIVSGLSGYAIGSKIPDLSNVSRKVKSGKISSKEGRDIYREKTRSALRLREIVSPLEKNAGIASAAGKLLWGGTKGASGAVWKGINPRSGFRSGEKTSFGRKLWTGATYGALGTGAIYTGAKTVSKLNPIVGKDHTRRSGSNYTTFLRNNTLSGNISPSELSQRDLISVRKLGMK